MGKYVSLYFFIYLFFVDDITSSQIHTSISNVIVAIQQLTGRNCYIFIDFRSLRILRNFRLNISSTNRISL